MKASHPLKLFITCAWGLESLLAEELQELGCEEIQQTFRGVRVKYTPQIVYRINYLSRLAGRVLLPLLSFPCTGRQSLYQQAYEIDWTKYIPAHKTFAIDSNVSHPAFNNSLFAAQVVKDALCDRFRKETGHRPSVHPHQPDIQIHLFIYQGKGTISIDTSRAPLFKRGYRTESIEAPIQESLAAAILRLARYSAADILLDPCCGSGTFLIEAAMMATNTPAGFFRTSWGFMDLPDFSQEEWLKIKATEDEKRTSPHKERICGIEINKNNAWITRCHLRNVGFHREIPVIHNDFRLESSFAPPSLIICNPPHGKRLGEVSTLTDLYQELGRFMKEKGRMKADSHARGVVFTGDPQLGNALTHALELPLSRSLPIRNSNIDAQLLMFDLS